MIFSMTGYGAGENDSFKVEMRSVNHRHLDVQIKMPPSLYAFEHKLRELIRGRFQRGRLDVYIAQTGHISARVHPDLDAARQVYDGLLRIKSELKIPGDVDIAAVAGIRDIYESTADEEIEIEKLIEPLEACMEQLEKMRADEGDVLKKDVSARIAAIEDSFSAIRPLAESHRVRVEASLAERLEKVRDDVSVDEARLAAEVLFYVEKADITEELVRAESHIAQYRRFLDNGGTVGRKLDFLAQEILREANTIASKTGRSEIAHLVVDIKDQLEKVREQVQNIQ